MKVAYRKVTYIEHSSFLVELDTCYLLFDYVQGEIPCLDKGKELYVFVSHRHGDHFSPVIFELADRYPKVQYVISDDIWQRRVPEELYGRIVFMGPDEERRTGQVLVKTYWSTDEGVAFLITVGLVCIYHAGDLNHWYWKGEEEFWNRQMGEKYHRELDKLKGERIDVAFLPVDARLEEYYCLGGDEFMKTVGANVVFPMHFWGDYGVGKRWKAEKCALEYRDKIIEIERQGEEFSLEL